MIGIEVSSSVLRVDEIGTSVLDIDNSFVLRVDEDGTIVFGIEVGDSLVLSVEPS